MIDPYTYYQLPYTILVTLITLVPYRLNILTLRVTYDIYLLPLLPVTIDLLESFSYL